MREMQEKIKQKFLDEKNEKEENNNLIVIENLDGTALNIEKANKIQIISILSSHIHAKDINEIRINKQKKRATINIKKSTECNIKSKTFIETMEKKENFEIHLSNQVKWMAKSIQKISVGVIKGAFIESEADMKWYWEQLGLMVQEVRKITPRVISVSFIGPLPITISLPYNNKPFKVEAYNPGPRRCMNCLQYGL